MLYCRCGEPISVDMMQTDGWSIPVFYTYDPLGRGTEIERCPRCGNRLSLNVLLSQQRGRDFSYARQPPDESPEVWRDA